MVKSVYAFRDKPMSERQSKKVDGLIHRYHAWNRFSIYGEPLMPDYNCCCREDGSEQSETEIQIMVADDAEAIRAASEFRGCGFIVTTEKVEV
jgi:hypothetical protein